MALWTATGLLAAGLAGSYVVAPWLAVAIGAYAIFRYQYLLEEGAGEAPKETLLRDVGLIVVVLSWAGCSLGILLLVR